MENRDIKKSDLQVNSNNAVLGRLRLAKSYSTSSYPVYFEIDLLSPGKIVTAVAMQDGANSGEHYVTAYCLSYNTDGSEWVNYVENGVVKVLSFFYVTQLMELTVIKDTLKF